ncbi:FtsK/SpoIIIE family DNA translocase [Effusibacillus lacus]|uniref:DNA translocase FtsK n=1 Tax=Effusibacillus lacus TaxID=1348429 RepID=A0A292YNV2_9BACL|nr:DNA translocase FtsK [Effusibacillus lacus]TCS73185.1 DNA translocase FtsK [Effusibacillus lacus]GAX90589.1 DNA translocase FtsK [Effusibacillus lacus]
MGKKKKNAVSQTKQVIKYEIIGLLLLAVAGLSLALMGPVGRTIARLFMYLAGNSYWLVGIYLIGAALYIMVKRQPLRLTMRHKGILLLIMVLLALSHWDLYTRIVPPSGKEPELWRVTVNRIETLYSAKISGAVTSPPTAGGGVIGYVLFSLMHKLFDTAGTLFVLVISGAISLLMIFGRSMVAVLGKVLQYGAGRFGKMKENVKETWDLLKTSPDSSNRDAKKNKSRYRPAPPEAADAAAAVEMGQDAETSLKIMDFADQLMEENKHPFPDKPAGKEKNPAQITIRYKDRGAVKPLKEAIPDYESTDPLVLQTMTQDDTYELPSLSLLEAPYGPRSGGDRKDLESNALKLQETLASFGVQVKVTEAHRGPTVTRYEIQPAVGVKVSRIVNLADDLALALAARDIRIEAPIPGKAAVGIEVPNREVAIVTLREVIESTEFQTAPSKLSIALGRDISGAPIVGNLAKMPHLLVAGATGSGKSVCINGIITSILYKAKPSEVKFIMIDPKMVELNVYNGIPHLLAPVVTDPRRAAYALKKVVQEMEQRYELFAKEGTRNMEGYNAVLTERGQQPLPFIVVIIDELADLMMVAPGDVEDAICRLAQMARAAGIHLILATQRPSVDVITGVIKANIPSRIAFAVSSQMDSRTILDMGGAERLLGRGDMLYLPVGESKPIRIQGAFLSDTEVERLVSYAKEQQAAAYHLDLSATKEESSSEEGDLDSLFWEAVKLVVESEQASVSMVQRRLKVGYSRAARLIDQMEDRGIVGPFEGSKPREVLLTKEQWAAMQEQ